jgi:hypothetical protein
MISAAYDHAFATGRAPPPSLACVLWAGGSERLLRQTLADRQGRTLAWEDNDPPNKQEPSSSTAVLRATRKARLGRR